MPKYQFFKLEQAQGDEYSYLAMAETAFLSKKEQLLTRGFEVVGDVVYAENEHAAIKLFNSGMTYPVEEYNKSTLIGGLIYAVQGLTALVRDRLNKKS